MNALKALAGIDKKLLLISPGIIQPIQHLKVEHLGNHNPRLHTDELLIALAICAVTNPMAGYAIDQLGALRDWAFPLSTTSVLRFGGGTIAESTPSVATSH